jgi:hypothetical protein
MNDWNGRFELPPIEAVDAVDVATLPAVVTQLSALAMRAAARMVPHPPEPTATPRITQEEAARLEGLALLVVRFLTRSGRVASVKEGKSRKLFQADLASYIQRCAELGVSLRHGPRPPCARGVLHGVTPKL